MADVLIRGMEEPPHCTACRMLDGDPDDGFCHAANKWFDDEYFRWYQYPDGDIATDKPLNCPLVPLPEGHGRLIDADRLKKVLEKNFGRLGGADVLRQMIDIAPTIVPAEGGKADG